MRKKILYFMPDNPISGKAGNTSRLNQMLSYFNDNDNIELHFVSLLDWGMWKKQDEMVFSEKFPNIILHLLDKKYKNNFFKYLLFYKIPYFFKRNSIDMTSYILRKEFRDVFKENSHFDTAVISYASWGKIIKGLGEKTYKIIDTHDFITAQKNSKRSKIGKYFQDEIDILAIYDEIWTYSIEEQYIFEQFTGKTVSLIPISFPYRSANYKTLRYKYEIIYVASDNPHNIKGINWFLTEVLPYVKNARIHLVGKICDVVKDFPNVVKHGLVNDLEEIYKNAGIAICPMLSGTGVKIKVLEALSHGLPVVTNRRGVDGLANKKNNGCIVTQDPKTFADEINRLLEDKLFYEQIKKEGRIYFSENHNYDKEKSIINLSLQKKV